MKKKTITMEFHPTSGCDCDHCEEKEASWICEAAALAYCDGCFEEIRQEAVFHAMHDAEVGK